MVCAFYPSVREEKWEDRKFSIILSTQWVQGPVWSYGRACQEKEGREEKGGRGRRYHVVALLNSRKVQGDFQDRAYHFVFGSVGGFGKPRWVATEAEVPAAGTGFLQNICFSATHMEKHLPFVMFVCLLAFDGKHCEISFGALPVVNLCNVWVSNCHIYFLLSSRQVCVLFSPLLNIEGYHT